MAGGTCYMFDVFTAGLCITAELKGLLEDPAIVKVMHDCRQDSAALYYQMGIKLRNIYDTQVTTAHFEQCTTPTQLLPTHCFNKPLQHVWRGFLMAARFHLGLVTLMCPVICSGAMILFDVHVL